MHDAERGDERKGYMVGVVDTSAPYFLLICDSTPCALLGQTATEFALQWLSEDEAVRERVRTKLDFFFSAKGTPAMRRMGRWGYLIYHATATSSNFYGRVHLQYVEPPMTLEQALQVWRRRSGGL